MQKTKQTNISIYLAVAPRVCLPMCLSFVFWFFLFSAIFVLYVLYVSLLPLTMSLDFCYIASFRDMWIPHVDPTDRMCKTLRMVKDDDSVSEDTVLEVDFDMNSPGDLAAWEKQGPRGWELSYSCFGTHVHQWAISFYLFIYLFVCNQVNRSLQGGCGLNSGYLGVGFPHGCREVSDGTTSLRGCSPVRRGLFEICQRSCSNKLFAVRMGEGF